jgi:LPXTG-site transpeptidase (sortase) family protein
MKTAGLLGVMVAAVVAAALTIFLAMQVDKTSGVGPSATTSPTTTQPAELGAPTRVTIPAIKVDATLIPVGLKPDGAMQTPDFGLAAWYDKGPKPGQPGPAVVLAHVDSKAGPDIFYKLKELKPGDQVTVHYAERAVTFAVTSAEQAAKTKLPAAKIWNDAKTPVLRLITCGGAFDRKAGSYLDNIIVYADQLVA